MLKAVNLLVLSDFRSQETQRGSFLTGATMSMKMSPVVAMQGEYVWHCTLSSWTNVLQQDLEPRSHIHTPWHILTHCLRDFAFRRQWSRYGRDSYKEWLQEVHVVVVPASGAATSLATILPSVLIKWLLIQFSLVLLIHSLIGPCLGVNPSQCIWLLDPKRYSG